MLSKTTCRIVSDKNGRMYCDIHNQHLLYVFDNGVIICSDGEDELIGKHGIKKYFEIINGWTNDKENEKK